MLKRTPLFEDERLLNAHFTEFAGWELPLYYTGIIKEHMAVRTAAGIFDISHLGKLFIQGAALDEFLQYMVTVDMSKVPVGRGGYALFCDEGGGVLDDEIVYKLGLNEYLTVPNASRTEIMLDWLLEHAPELVTIENRTDELCLLALQGPQADAWLANVFALEPTSFKRYSITNTSLNGYTYLVMRSGYTGEKGFEIVAGADAARHVWRALIERGVTPCGIGARDTLRLEMGYPLYGRDLTTSTTPLEAGLIHFVAFEKGDFIGKEALLEQQRTGIRKQLIGFVMDEGIAREDTPILDISTFEQIGEVTSGSYSPVLRAGIGMGYIGHAYYHEGLEIYLGVREKLLQGHIARRPFIDSSKTYLPQTKAS